MAAPPWNSEYTGEIRFRRTLFGKLVLQVEHRGSEGIKVKNSRFPARYWADADEIDLERVNDIRHRKGKGPLA